MNTLSWLEKQVPSLEDGQPLQEDGTREDPGNRPQVPDPSDNSDVGGDRSADETREHHGGEIKDQVEHVEERTFVDDYDPADHVAEVVETVSTEGLVEGIRKFFGVHNRGKDFKEADGKNPHLVVNLTKQLADTFGSAEWLKKQTPVKGEVKVSDISKAINLSDILGSLQTATATNMQVNNALTEATRKFYLSIKEGLDLVGSQGNLTDQAYEKLKQQVAEAKPVSELYAGPVKINPVAGEPVETIEPMSIDAMPEMAKAVTKHIDGILHAWLDFAEATSSVSKALMNDEFTELMYFGAHPEDEEYRKPTRGNQSKYNDEAWLAVCGSIQRKVDQNTVPAARTAVNQLEAALHAAVVYMERSIKGGKTE